MDNTTVETVTLTSEKGTWVTPADTELSIHETAQWSGYSALSLRRIDNAQKEGFPRAHHKIGSMDRLWYAHDIGDIIAYKIKAGEDHKKATSSIYKLANAKRKKAKAAAKKKALVVA